VLEGREVFVTASIGIAVYPDDGNNADDLVKHADSAMYLAKRSGRNDYRFYSKELTVQASERFAVETTLRRAVERKELELYFQPKINLADGALIGSEALVRWNHPKLGLVPPDQFIGIAEDSGLIVGIGEWVLREACHIAREWNAADMPLHRVAINLSARQFQSGDLAKTVNRILEETDCLPEWIELEITESMLLDEQGGVLETLNQLQTLGIAIAIDDFGTGYSSLSYLARYPINTLKIDRIFVTDIAVDPHRAELVKAIIAIARNLELTVVAEGVDTKEQAANLRQMGCHIAQGYLYSKPLPKATFQPLLTSFGKASNLGNTGKWMKHLSFMSHLDISEVRAR
jgi:EAL domain-containing protein (putative c-di-GMP-specific phosphodiesterase class I)